MTEGTKDAWKRAAELCNDAKIKPAPLPMTLAQMRMAHAREVQAKRLLEAQLVPNADGVAQPDAVERGLALLGTGPGEGRRKGPVTDRAWLVQTLARLIQRSDTATSGVAAVARVLGELMPPEAQPESKEAATKANRLRVSATPEETAAPRELGPEDEPDPVFAAYKAAERTRYADAFPSMTQSVDAPRQESVPDDEGNV